MQIQIYALDQGGGREEGREGWGQEGVAGERPCRNSGHGWLVEKHQVGPQCAQRSDTCRTL